MLTQDRLKELLTYNPDTGVFTRRIGVKGYAAGTQAGTCLRNGYSCLGVDGKLFYAHRLAFLYMTGEQAAAQVDHINGDRTDNRWTNLRLATASENHENLGGAKSHNRLGFLGVTFHKETGKYRARIKRQGVITGLGLHATPELAHAAYLRGKAEIHTHHDRLIERKNNA
jgi:HNH endonuclease